MAVLFASTNRRNVVDPTKEYTAKEYTVLLFAFSTISLYPIAHAPHPVVHASFVCSDTGGTHVFPLPQIYTAVFSATCDRIV